MGLIFSYFRRPKDAVAELEGIETKLSRLETWRQSQLSLQKRLLGYLLISFLIGYPVALGVYYAYCMPTSSRLVLAAHAAAFLAVLPLFYGLRRCLLWSFVRSLSNCEQRMRQLREDKQKVLDRVMDTETYKRAKEILDRFDPDRFKAEFQQNQQQQQPPGVKLGQFFNKSPLSKRPAQPSQHHRASAAASLASNSGGGVVLRQLSAVPSSQPQPQPHSPQGLLPQQNVQLPRPVLARDRSVMDRVIDLLVGDGADRRYALICRRCCGHNGMALAEEFPFLAWRCAYCAFMHAPRQVRPAAPLLDHDQQQQQRHQQHPRRPQHWQSLMDLRTTATASLTSPPPAAIASAVAAVAAGTQSLRSSSSTVSNSSSPPSRVSPTQPQPQQQELPSLSSSRSSSPVVGDEDKGILQHKQDDAVENAVPDGDDGGDDVLGDGSLRRRHQPPSSVD